MFRYLSLSRLNGDSSLVRGSLGKRPAFYMIYFFDKLKRRLVFQDSVGSM